MSYATRAEVAALVPANVLERALDFDGDGIEDPGAFAAAAAVVDGEIDALLSPAYSVPFTTVPALVSHAARVLGAELAYRRNSVKAEDNPFTKQADALRDQLRAIGQGDGSLSAELSTDEATGHTDDDDLTWSTDNQDGI